MINTSVKETLLQPAVSYLSIYLSIYLYIYIYIDPDYGKSISVPEQQHPSQGASRELYGLGREAAR